MIVGRGTHDELLADCPTYQEIVQSQIGEKSARVATMTTVDEPQADPDALSEEELTRQQTGDQRAAGRWNSLGVPTEKSKDFGSTRATPRPPARPRALRADPDRA